MPLDMAIHKIEITLIKGRQLARAVDEIGAESTKAPSTFAYERRVAYSVTDFQPP